MVATRSSVNTNKNIPMVDDNDGGRLKEKAMLEEGERARG